MSDLVGSPEDRFSRDEAHIYRLEVLDYQSREQTSADETAQMYRLICSSDVPLRIKHFPYDTALIFYKKTYHSRSSEECKTRNAAS